MPTRSDITLATMVVGPTAVVGTVTGIMAVTPDVAATTGATQAELQLIVDAATVALGALVIPFGAVLDRVGRRRGLLIGFSGLLVALVLTIPADTPLTLLVARVATGFFGAIALPGTLSTLTAVVSPERRGAAVGAWSAGMVFGGIYGIAVGGVFAQIGAWQLMPLGLGVPVLACLVATIAAVPETRDPENVHLDPLGSVLCLAASGLGIFSVIEAPIRGLGDPLIWCGLLGSGLLLLLFLTWEQHTPLPMLDLGLFKNRSFSCGVGGAFMLFAASFGWFFLSFQYNQYVLDYSPLASAACLIPSGLTTIPFAVIGPRVAARFGWRRLEAVALLLSGVAFLIMGIGGKTQALWPQILGGGVFGIGLGLAQGPLTEAILGALPAARHGVASAINDACRELGSAFGVAVFGAVFNAAYRARIDGAELQPDALAHAARSSPAAGAEATRILATRLKDALDVIKDATVSGWTAAFLVGAGMWTIAAVTIYTLGPREVASADTFSGLSRDSSR